MKHTLGLRIILMLSGSISLAVGTGILLFPHSFHGSAGIVLGDDVNLLNEMRSSGGALLMVGLFILLGAFLERFSRAAIIASAVIYLSYGFSRLLSMAVDGMPGDALVQIMALEIGMGVVCCIALARYRLPMTRSSSDAL